MGRLVVTPPKWQEVASRHLSVAVGCDIRLTADVKAKREMRILSEL